MVSENIRKIQDRIQRVCAKINRDPSEITIVAVSKNRTADQIKEAILSGVTNIGENKVQEAFARYNLLGTPNSLSRAESRDELRTIKWHMVGHLQTNKVKDAVRIFDLIHSVDSLRLAQEINKQAARINKIQDILLEIKTSPEATKFGILPEKASEVIKEVSGLRNIRIKGLMTIVPLTDDPQKTRPYFRQLRALLNEIRELRTPDSELTTLSMGMTDDFEVAIEEGSTMVRLGRAIFESKG